MSSAAEANISAAALAIALVALFTALGQLIQQYFATADGYRRCQKSVMGGYSRHTRLRWRWREFRFETLYTVPKIFMVGDGAPSRIEQVLLTGSALTREKSLVPWERRNGESLGPFHETPQQLEARRTQNWLAKGVKPKPSASHSEKVCWLSFLSMIHEATFAAVKELQIHKDTVYAPP
ncbi:hypothetical protein HYALB_00002936 [Hymenoscyphus albidus]|uniref:Modin n=1 Tax=Hymenoscyphus albidus TaxID=595503 RepID=A0A9N9Q1Y9_9HELO|nr:hypothetical protein HYALB_00002936 [Hymenoscyphus albidus]